MIKIIVYILAAATVFTSVRILLGPSVWDRLLGFNLMSSKLIMIMVMCSIIFEKNFLLDIALTYALLGFVSTLFIARFVRDRGKI
ncbi:MAG: monovalent cation/H+ antiporter complex subunit F [Clostridia bacterium]|jgi:multicomponent Na+:H+ antiporter subunit F|nr:monovalent cation/H+ antiporter complex subunit F [Clostridia bacterium]